MEYTLGEATDSTGCSLGKDYLHFPNHTSICHRQRYSGDHNPAKQTHENGHVLLSFESGRFGHSNIVVFYMGMAGLPSADHLDFRQIHVQVFHVFSRYV